MSHLRTNQCVFDMEFSLPVIVENEHGMAWFLNFTRKNNFLSLLRRIRIKTHFPLICPLITFSRSLFKALADNFVSRTTKEREVSSAKGLGFDDNSFDKSLM